MVKKKNRSALFIGAVILALFCIGVLFTVSIGDFQQLRYQQDIFSQEGTGEPVDTFYFNVTVTNVDDEQVENVFVIVFEGTTAKVYGYTDENGLISFQMPAGEYLVQFEKYKYEVASEYISFDDHEEFTQQMISEESEFFGIPAWLFMPVLGLVFLGLIYFNRESLNLTRWKKPLNWFGGTKTGSWTFIDKSTKTVLYAIMLILIVVLIAFVIPNFSSLELMAYYYVALGLVSFVFLALEGQNKRYPVAALGFGKKDELGGDIALGIAFALIFIGLTGFISQLSFISLSELNTIVSLFMVVIVASFFEEAFHSGVLAPTIAEKLGILPSILLTSVVFMMGHGVAYGWVLVPLFTAFLFRIIATSLVLYKKSWTGVFIAHVIINTLSVFTIIMFR